MSRREAMNALQKEDFCDLIRNGHLRFDACRQLNLTVAQVKNAYRADPDFRLDLDEALLEATEPVENAVYTAAKEGDLSAAKWWLEHRDKERWGPQEQKIHVVHEQVGAELLESVRGLAGELERRRALAQAIETGGTLIELEPPAREPTKIYEPGKAPVFHSIATREGQRSLKKKAAKAESALPTGLPPRPGAQQGES